MFGLKTREESGFRLALRLAGMTIPLDRWEVAVKDFLCSRSFGTLAATFFGCW